MKFTKMHGCGNDYVYVNCLEEKINHPGVVAEYVSDRHFGIGSDGMILICPSDAADFRMEMYNLDGSEGSMCGNGIRCVAKYVYEKGMTPIRELVIKSCDRLVTLTLTRVEKTMGKAGCVQEVRVNMGCPIFEPEKIPVTECESRELAIGEPIWVCGRLFTMTCVSMGNPHAVIFVEELTDFLVSHMSNYAFPPEKAREYFGKLLPTLGHWSK